MATHMHMTVTQHNTILAHMHMCDRATCSSQWLPATKLHARVPLSTCSEQQQPSKAHGAAIVNCPPLPGEPRRTPPKSSSRLQRQPPLSAAPRSNVLRVAAPLAAQVDRSSIRLRGSVPAPHMRPVGVTPHPHAARACEQRQGARGRLARAVAAVCVCGDDLQGWQECRGWCCSGRTWSGEM